MKGRLLKEGLLTLESDWSLAMWQPVLDALGKDERRLDLGCIGLPTLSRAR